MSVMFRRLQWLALALSLVLRLGPSTAEAADKPARTVWDGVYAPAQAERGQTAYALSCRRCHGEDLTSSGNVLRGGKFMDHWREDNLKSLFTILKSTMPRDAPRSLPDSEYVDIVAFLLEANAFPAGSEELKADTLESVLIVGKEGAQPVPNFALITVVGCMTQVSADTWTLRNASEPVRNRNPWELTATEVSDFGAKTPGQNTFRLLDVRSFPKETRAGRWMAAKGLLIRAPGDDRINVTWLQTIGETCKQPQ